jgi:hypothetical protein
LDRVSETVIALFPRPPYREGDLASHAEWCSVVRETKSQSLRWRQRIGDVAPLRMLVADEYALHLQLVEDHWGVKVAERTRVAIYRFARARIVVDPDGAMAWDEFEAEAVRRGLVSDEDVAALDSAR